jgi:hypothetical protein
VDETLETELRPLLDIEGVALYCTRVQSGAAAAAERTHGRGRLRLHLGARPSSARERSPTPSGNDARPTRWDRSRDRRHRPVHGRQSRLRAPWHQAAGLRDALHPQRIGGNAGSPRGRGIDIVAFGSFEQSEEHLIARISPDSVREALLRVGSRRLRRDIRFLHQPAHARCPATGRRRAWHPRALEQSGGGVAHPAPGRRVRPALWRGRTHGRLRQRAH